MTKVITYGTYDLLHYGHIRLLERAKALGDYLIVGVTADDFDKTRGKINVQQSLMERVEAVRATGIADEIIVEEYEGQKIDDIRRYDVDIFTVGSDWKGKFDYLNEYCKVVYLERTEGISSSEIRSEKSKIRLGLSGNAKYINKFFRESRLVNGLDIIGIYSTNINRFDESTINTVQIYDNFELLLTKCDAVYIHSSPELHFSQIKKALMSNKHVICESPIALYEEQYVKLKSLAKQRNLVLMDSLRTAYSTAFDRMILLIKSGQIGEIVSIDATCTSLLSVNDYNFEGQWGSFAAWIPTALLPIFDLLGTNYRNCQIITKKQKTLNDFDLFTNINFVFGKSVASVKVGYGAKSEGQLIISGTQGYVYVPAPWWKTDYFEIRYEDSNANKRYFYKLEGEGIRNELVAFVKAIKYKKEILNITEEQSKEIVKLMQKYYIEKDYIEI